ncbi:DUF2470 domain-containing protein [Streptomyces finlayi]|uniref:DUF2470 domain-containing protein n=1 Tax=Streptomyces finlayi TaxID=67296 RepID=A0A7G7BSY9_9ACTN|nr:DUF2470 domain-containing protein [Streptomyces finlayi]QNE78454.1 DUF2470 domain-containing protein [Streptomyces finlayi]
MPSAAERTRTLVQSTCSAALVVPGLDVPCPDHLVPSSRSVGPEGDLFLEFPVGSPAVRAATRAQGDGLGAVLELTDVAPVSVPHRIRGRAWISGRLTAVPGPAQPGRMLLRLETAEAYVDDLWGAQDVEPEAFRDAAADPLVAHEAELLQHLHAAHSDRMGMLRALLGARTACDRAAPRPSAVPVALDRFGLRVRFVEAHNSCFDARFEFPEPVQDVGGLRRAMHTLFEAASC